MSEHRWYPPWTPSKQDREWLEAVVGGRCSPACEHHSPPQPNLILGHLKTSTTLLSCDSYRVNHTSRLRVCFQWLKLNMTGLISSSVPLRPLKSVNGDARGKQERAWEERKEREKGEACRSLGRKQQTPHELLTRGVYKAQPCFSSLCALVVAAELADPSDCLHVKSHTANHWWFWSLITALEAKCLLSYAPVAAHWGIAWWWLLPYWVQMM